MIAREPSVLVPWWIPDKINPQKKKEKKKEKREKRGIKKKIHNHRQSDARDAFTPGDPPNLKSWRMMTVGIEQKTKAEKKGKM